MKTIAIILGLACAVLAQQPATTQQPLKPITGFADLEFGMPQDYVLTSLQKMYRLENESAPRPFNWTVWNGKDYLGEVLFTDGTLRVAALKLYQGSDAAELGQKLFSIIYENSEKSDSEEDKHGTVITRNRTRELVISSLEMIALGRLHIQTLRGCLKSFIAPPD